ncbi:hypothetical protein [Helicobacter sp. 12S02634-8]|uniref:hypothetical protein n=1 Tax=Helicobacter sp. 12S02634-8 TaxID=1476199 RepID=UPI00209BE872|nr:hypothetical protein [Helicobacter sp. 12S02634-8]
MFYQFHTSFHTSQYFLDPAKLKERLKSKEIYRLKQDLKLNQKEYENLLKSTKQNEDDFIAYDHEFFRLGFRDIARDTDEHTAIFSLLPKNIGCGNTVWSSIPKRYALLGDSIKIECVSYLRLLFALGIFNSLIIDFLARQMVQIHLNKTYLERLPLPQPNDAEILNNPIYHSIAINALKLQLYNDPETFCEISNMFGIQKDQIPLTPKLYDQLKAQNEIAVAKLYGISYEEFCHLLKSFQVLANKKPEYIALITSPKLWE